MSAKGYERLGAFYLGRRYDADRAEATPEPLLYDAKDLTTHAVCVGMTGSGKTGLGITLIEEAAIDGIPVIAIDPKGDLGNLLLTFPSLRASDFRPWIDDADALRHGRTPDEHAQATADLWRAGLTEWGQSPGRIRDFANAVDRTIYTPGSRDGAPLTVLKSFDEPPPAVIDDAAALHDRLEATTSGLLGLIGIDADPLRSREHILVATLLERAWRSGYGLDLPTLIQQVQKPPVNQIGVLDVESVFPSADRLALAMSLNNVLASPGFSVWREGEPLDVARLLTTAEGRPRLSIVSVAHLTDVERMFFVTMLLNELVTWVRSQPGSRSLRAILYMDEVFGYFPPTANPPSKKPMLTLLKQARAQGLGVVLATQNPVDLDYKGLSNAGTWLVGRLQTERDKARLMDGLESASTASGFERGAVERLISGLSARVFLMHNAHDDGPSLFHTRWALSYLAGPLTGPQIRRLMADRQAVPSAAPSHVDEPLAGPVGEAASSRPTTPAGVEERFLLASEPRAEGERLVYRPALGATATLHYVSTGASLDEWQEVSLLAPLWSSPSGSPWGDAVEARHARPALQAEPQEGVAFAALPASASNGKSYQRWAKMLSTHLYRARQLRLWRCRDPKLVSRPGESEGDFRARLREAVREERDLAIEKLRGRYAAKLARVQDKLARARQRVEVQESQYSEKRTQAAISVGATLVGALLGRKIGSLSTLGRATTAVRGAGRAARERGDIARAEEQVADAEAELRELERRFEEDLGHLRTAVDPQALEVSSLDVSCRKADLDVQPLLLVWAPFLVDGNGIARPAYDY